MKTTNAIFLSTLSLVLVFIFFQACGSKKFHREIETPEIKINLVGNKPTSMDPFSVGLVVTNKKTTKNVTLNLEVYASELDEKNPTFTKKSADKYSLTFEQTDHTTRELILSTSNDEVIVEEVL
ncbi:MAG: hypothetical protein JWO58_1795 [Chitinophagaceae bacterium]|nr:hypothetical protein [Chitinophagaceae bacterium]